MSIAATDTTLVVIAGGAGSRMGVPKHSIRIAGRPILEDLLRRAGWDGPTILSLDAGTTGPVGGAEGFGAVVHDAASGLGPLAGVVRALGACRTAALVAVPVDMCEFSHEHLAWFVERAARIGAEAAMMRRRLVAGEPLEPFPLYLTRASGLVIEGMFARGERALRNLTRVPGFECIDAPANWPESVWTNLNTPDDLARAERARGYTEPSSASRPRRPEVGRHETPHQG